MKNFIFCLSLALAGASAIQALPVYWFQVDTSPLSGQAGNLDFQFNPGNLSTQAATANVSYFVTDGTLGSPAILTGDVTPVNAQLPTSFTLGNSSGFNDLFQPITFGLSLSFFVTFGGPAVTLPDGISTASSVFAFSLYDQPGVTPLLTSDPSGAVGLVSVNLDGSTTPQSLAPAASIAAIPEPGAGLLVMCGALLLAVRFGLRSSRIA